MTKQQYKKRDIKKLAGYMQESVIPKIMLSMENNGSNVVGFGTRGEYSWSSMETILAITRDNVALRPLIWDSYVNICNMLVSQAEIIRYENDDIKSIIKRASKIKNSLKRELILEKTI